MEKNLQDPVVTPTGTLEQRTDNTIDTDLEALFEKLVAFPTISDDLAANHASLEFIADYLQQRGMYVQRFDPTDDAHETLIASTRPDNAKTPTILLAAHGDVITANESMFHLRKEDGKYFGRGVFDMKFAIAAYLKIVDELKDTLSQYDFAIMITSDEELGGRDGVNSVRKFVKDGYLPKVVVLPDGGEEWQLETASNGYMHLAFEARGKTGHGSRPWLGDNAVERLIDALYDIRVLFKDHGPETDTINAATIRTSDVPANQIPDYASADISIRLRHPGRLLHWRQTIGDICEKHRVTIVERAGWDATYNDPENLYVHRFADVIEDVTGVKNIGFHSYAGSDARFFAEAGVPYANTYPTGGGHHSDHEWLAVGSLARFKEVVLRYVQEVSKDL